MASWKSSLLTEFFPQSILVYLCIWYLKTFDCVLLTTKHEVKYICVHPLASARSSLETVYSRIRHYKHPLPTPWQICFLLFLCAGLVLAVQDSAISWSFESWSQVYLVCLVTTRAFQAILYLSCCGFSSNWILLYIPLSVRSSVRPSQAWHLTFPTYIKA